MDTTGAVEPLYSLNLSSGLPWQRRLFSLVRRPLSGLLSIDAINDLYAGAKADEDGRPFARRVLDRLGVQYYASSDDLKRIPAKGPIVVVANHPFGGIEGLVLADLLTGIRPDVKIMANHILRQVPELRDLFIFVDPFGGPEATRANMRAMKESIDWVRQGGLLAVFPAGAVSHLKLQSGCVTDPKWSPTVGRIVAKAKCPALSLFIEGCNGPLFQMAGLVHPMLRTALLPRQLFKRRGQTLGLRVGTPIAASSMESFGPGEELTEYLRLRTYMLADRAESGRAAPARRGKAPAAIVEAEPAESLAAEVAALPEACQLSASNELAVFLTTAEQTPRVLREIGRLREVAFRATGEGTGQPLDLDRFDQWYEHLWVWNRARQEVVGSYRLARTDRVLATQGIRGFYTQGLFNYRRELLDRIGLALELGRSFVRPEYQRSYAPLLLLWKGIAAVVARSPQYKTLLGAVSITSEYHTVSRQLMVTFLKLHSYREDLARLVRPRTPPRAGRVRGWDLGVACTAARDIDDVGELVCEIENGPKGVPILLKQYLKLGGKLLGFNVDPDFGDALDGLIYVDLTRCDRRVLDKYMGKSAAEGFCEWHGKRPAVTGA